MQSYTAFFMPASVPVDQMWFADQMFVWEFAAQSAKEAEKLSFAYAKDRQWDVVSIIALPHAWALNVLTDMLAEAKRKTHN